MATPSGSRSGSLERPLADLLFDEGFSFDFFQAMLILERLSPDRAQVGGPHLPTAETVRFLARLSLDFPPSSIHEVKAATPEFPVPAMTVSFMGLTGPSGVLPRHYTELLLRQHRENKGEERTALRAWLDLFNHRFISLFYRAWDKYRFLRAFLRGECNREDPDPFTLGLFSLMGLGMPALRGRLKIVSTGAPPVPDGAKPSQQNLQALARIDDLALLRYSGFFAQRPRNAVSLEAMLRSFLGLPVKVLQFQGQWLKLEPMSCSALGAGGMNNAMGRNVIVGDRVWDVQSLIRIRLGPLTYERFQAFLPDRSPRPERKMLFLLAKLVRLYIGPEWDLEFQLVLKKEEVPACRLGPGGEKIGSRLGWNSWSRRKARDQDAEEAVFRAKDLVWVQ